MASEHRSQHLPRGRSVGRCFSLNVYCQIGHDGSKALSDSPAESTLVLEPSFSASPSNAGVKKEVRWSVSITRFVHPSEDLADPFK